MRREMGVLIETQEDLEEILEYWVERLGLQDWEIYIFFVRKVIMPNELGDVEYTPCSKQALIRILTPGDFENNFFKWDMEETVVHELLHIKFALFSDMEDVAAAARHQLIEELARILVRLSREEIVECKSISTAE